MVGVHWELAKDHLPASLHQSSNLNHYLYCWFCISNHGTRNYNDFIRYIVAINALLNFNYALSGLVIGGLYQVLVIFGLHWMVVPLIANEIAQTGQSQLNALVNFTMIAQGAGALAVFAKLRLLT